MGKNNNTKFGSNQSNQLLLAGLGLAATASILFYVFYQQQHGGSGGDSTVSEKVANDDNVKTPSKNVGQDKEEEKKIPSSSSSSTTKSSSNDDIKAADAGNKKNRASELLTPVASNKTKLEMETDDKAIHAKVEELDKKGKELFKKKEFFEAAQLFTEALDFIEKYSVEKENVKSNPASSLYRQVITLTNNRSAMYEKGKFIDLALDDCNAILDIDMNHTKARTRKLRILESTEKNYEALIEVCCFQLLYMQEHRDKLKFGLPCPEPPVPQSKLEDLMNLISPPKVVEYMKKKEEEPLKSRPLPSSYTISQLLKSYSSYNSWMSKAARGGSIDVLSESLPSLDNNEDKETIAKYCTILMKRGQRHVYEGQYKDAPQDFEDAYALCSKDTEIQELMEGDTYARLNEWTGMMRHWRFDLDGAMECYFKCLELEPTNGEIIVKQAGVQMDAAKFDKALGLLEIAIDVDPNAAADAKLHRANLSMLQAKPIEAKTDLIQCIELRPNHVQARLRLAAIHVAMNEIKQAESYLEAAEEIEPTSSEIQSYRGELAFTQGDFVRAKEKFSEALKLEPKNPTPYVNLALVILNTPPTGGSMIPDTTEAINKLQKAIDVDPMFHAAYVQLGQLKLGTASDLSVAHEVVELYDQGLRNCRSADEIKDLVNMRTLATAQIDAAASLKMETFTMQ